LAGRDRAVEAIHIQKAGDDDDGGDREVWHRILQLEKSGLVGDASEAVVAP